MKKYKYKFSPLVLILLTISIIVAIACFAWNVARFLQKINAQTEITVYNYITLIITAVLSVVFAIIAIGIIFKSYYEITSTSVILHWGILKNNIDLKDVKEVVLFSEKNKLVMYFKDESFFVIVVKSEWYEDFVDELKEVAPNIFFIINSDIEKK